jgi:hypothetical protein
MLTKIEFFEVYRVLWVLEFVDTDLEDHHLQIKYFTCIILALCPVVDLLRSEKLTAHLILSQNATYRIS